MLRRKCSQGTLTQSKRHIMACVNYLQKHLLSYGSINLCTWWRLSSPLLCSRQGAAGHRCLLPPAIWQRLISCILRRSRVPLAERRGFFLSLLQVPFRQCREFHWTSPPCPKVSSPPLPSHKPRTTPSNFGHVHPECHSPDPCTLFLFTSRFMRTTLPSVLLQEKGLDQGNEELHRHSCKYPPDKLPHRCLAV